MSATLYEIGSEFERILDLIAAPPAEELPEEYQRVKVEVDCKKLAAAFKAGKDLPPGVFVEQGRHLRIS